MQRVATLILLLILSACAASGVHSPRISLQETQACQDVRSITSQTVESVSRDGNDLLISVLDRVPCNMHATKPGVKITGTAVEVSWKWVLVPPNEVMKCLCGRRLLFRVEGAPAEELSVTAVARN